MKNCLFLILLTACFTSLQGLEDESPIIVHLETEKQLIPIHIAPISGSGFSPSYLKQLENVLTFDLNHNGMTKVVPAKKAYHTIKVTLDNQKLGVRLISTHGGDSQGVDDIPLNGDLNHDRRQIHRLADVLHKALFGTNGIASTRFLYTKRIKNGDTLISDVWEADYDGHNARQVTHNAGYCVTPTYIPPKPGFSAGSFSYVAYKEGQPKIYVASLKDGVGRRLTSLRGNQLMPTISRQRDQVAFISDVTGNPDLFLQPFSPDQGAIGKAQQIFAARLATQGTPTFSPDGKRIAFVSNKDGSPRIYAMEVPAPGTSVKTLKPTLITKYTRGSTAPAWSPDGTKIAYCAKVDGVRQIWVYHFDTNEERQLTEGHGNKENPTWAPNSLHLIFNSSDRNASELYLINLNQTQFTKISNGPGEKRFPAWNG